MSGRRISIVAGAAFALLLAGGAVAVALMDAERFRPALKVQLEKALGRPVQLGRLKHTLLPLSLRVESVEVDEDPRFGTGAFLKAREIGIRANLWPLLLRRRVEIQSVEIVEPRIELIRRDGVWNYASLGGGGGQSDSPTGGNVLPVGRIDLVDGQAAATLDGAPRLVYPKTTLAITDISPGRANMKIAASGSVGEMASGNVSGAAEWRDGSLAGSLSLRDGLIGKSAIGPAELKFDIAMPAANNAEIRSAEIALGKLTLRAKGSIRGEQRQLALDLAMPRAPIADLVQLAAAFGQGLPPGLQAEGQLAGELQVRGTAAEPIVTGRIDAGELKLSGGAVKRAVHSRAVAIDLLPDAVRSGPFEVACGRTKLSGYFSVRDYAKARPLLESAVITEDSDLSDLLQIAQAYGAADTNLRASGKATLRLRVHGALVKGSALQLSGQGKLAGVTLESPKMSGAVKLDRAEIDFPSSTGGVVSIGRLEFNRLALTNVRAKTSYRNGVVSLDPLSANLFGGSTSGRLSIDTRGTNSAFALDSRLERIESSQLMTAISSLPQLISGPLAADVKLTWAPGANEDTLRAMSGKAALRFAGGKLHTMNLLGELGAVAKFVGGPKVDDKLTSFLAMQGELTLDKGVAQTNGLRFDLADATATFSGGMNFADQSVSMQLLSVLNSKLAQEVGGTRIGGYLTAAVRNAKGELIIPTLVSGTLTKPRFVPDASAIAKLKVQNAVPEILDAVKGGKVGLKDMIGILGGAAKKKQ